MCIRDRYTVEQVIQSNGNLTLDQAIPGPIPLGFTPDIYNVQPALGFYCLYKPRPGETPTNATPVCPNIEQVAKQHAEWLTDAGFDYIAVDISNWPLVGPIGPEHFPSTDMTILRPLQVLAEEWLALRARGIKTPSIAAFVTTQCGAVACTEGKEGGTNYAMWRWLLDTFYNDPTYSQIVHTLDQRKVMFLPSSIVPAYHNASLVDLIEANGGRNDVRVISMWAMDESYFCLLYTSPSPRDS
eukprot:TRINITY_DN7498_c0_g1_i4.p1 TRINITY_DN7498_c0_g1~~TRINITY_DN7498_c0_g1_i4.p1  ORF type:complete len:242 (-),score=54.42 TRINITY_DN7498_c0_g1_i4:104-829(-)